MSSPKPGLKKAALNILVLSFCLFGAGEAAAQKRQAVIILRSPGGGASVAQCDGTAELNYQIATDVKLKNKEEVRMASNVTPAGESTRVSREVYEKTLKAKMKDLYALKWGADGVLYAVSVEGQSPVPVLPDDAKPQKNADQPLSSFYSAMFTGEGRDGKQKRQISLAAHDVLKIYFVPEGSAVNDTLFRHAAEEKSVVLWEAYLKKTSNYRQSEANSFMRGALITCARADLVSFNGGDFAALDKARQRAGRANSVQSDGETSQLMASVEQAQQKVDGVRTQVDGLIRADKFDEAISAADPIKIYLPTWPALNDMYQGALKESHTRHLHRGEEALRGKQLDAALSECTLAWGRLRDSAAARDRLPDPTPARDCVCKSRNAVALRDSGQFRLQRRPKDAKELLEKQLADSDCARDEAVAKELTGAKCEYAQQLLAESRRLVGGGAGGGATVVRTAWQPPQRPGRRGKGVTPVPVTPKPSFAGVKAINAQNKKDFREAREKLVLASDQCPEEAVRTLLASVNRSLSGYCLEEARKAIGRGDVGTAYVYLQTAQGYTPDDSNVLSLLGETRNEFEERTRVSVGVVLDDKSGSPFASSVINDIVAAVESVATESGLSQPVVLEQGAAKQSLQAIQSGRALKSPTAIFYGDLLAANVSSEGPSRSVSSTYYEENPERRRWDRMIDEKKELYNNCKKQYGEPACAGQQNEIEQMRARRNAMPRELPHSYSYRATSFRVGGDLRMSFRATDSISRSAQAAETLGANVSYQCEQREEVNPGDRSASNSACSVQSREEYVGQMVVRVRADARSRASEQLRALPLNYYKRARAAANKQQAVEDYLRFLFLTGNKSGAEASDAQRALLVYDPELKTDGVLR